MRIIVATTVMAIVSFVGQTIHGEDATNNMKDVTFRATCDGTEQKYVIMLPGQFSEDTPHDLLIALHGHGADRWQCIASSYQEFAAARDVAARHGMIYVSPDYRASTSWMGPKAESDVEQIIKDIREKHRTGRVFICGASMGGSSCLTFAALHPDLVDGVASMNGTANHVEYANFQDAISDSFGGTKAEVPDEYRKRSAELWPERFTMPVGIAAGGKDDSVPPQSVLRLAEKLKAANPDKVLLIYREDGGHSTSYEDAAAIIEFVVKSNSQP